MTGKYRIGPTWSLTLLKENVKNVKEETRKEVEKMRVHVR